jgi:hypothetical protein
MDRTARLLRVAFVIVLLAVAAYLIIGAFEPFRSNWGDPWSDGNAMTSGRYFANDGFIATRFTPILDVGPLGPDSLRYTHYPPLPDIVNGLIQCAIGGGHLAIHRLIAILLSAIAVFFFYLYTKSLWTPAIARVAVVVLATNILFIEYADSIHHIPIYSMTGWGCLVAAVRWLDDGRRRWLFLVAVSTFLCFLASYDFCAFLAVMVPATILLRKHRLVRGRGLALLLTFGVSGLTSIVTKNLLVIWATGYEAWHQDLVFQFFERSSDRFARTLKDGIGTIVFWRLWRVFTPLFFAGVLIQVVALFDRVRGHASEISLRPLVLLFAAVPFLYVFSQLVAEQSHPMLLLLPFAAVNLAVIVIALWTQQRRVVAAAIIAIYVFLQASQLAAFRKEFLRVRDVASVEKILVNDHHRFIITNFLVDGPLRYSWQRHLVGMDRETRPSSEMRTLAILTYRQYLDIYGDESPLTIVQFKHMRTHMFERALYTVFANDRRWMWIGRAQRYRGAWTSRLNANDRMWDEALRDVGKVVYESPDVRARQVTRADLDQLQLAGLPDVTPSMIDFATWDASVFIVDGFSEPVEPFKDIARGSVVLVDRYPSQLTFTMHGLEYKRTEAAPNRTSTLRLRLAPKAVRLELEMSTVLAHQEISIAVNGRKLLTGVGLTASDHLKTIAVDVPADVLLADGVQVIELTHAIGDERKPAMLHRMWITPL